MNRKHLAGLIAFLAIAGCTKDFEQDSIPTSVNGKSDEATECYYWAGNEKVFFKSQPEKSFILFRGADRYSLVDSRKMDYSVFKTSRLPEGCMFRKGLTRSAELENISWAIGTTKGFDCDSEDIIYKCQAYKSSKGNDIFISHLFYVKLKDAADYPALERLAEENKVEILNRIEKMDLWYKLSCTSESDCDAMGMAARFYESGLVRYAEPDIMFEIRSCSRQPNSYPEYRDAITRSVSSVPNDPLFPNQWYLHNPNGLDINYLAAREITKGNSNITILVIDPEGITYNHPDLPDNINAYYDYNIALNHGDCHATECIGVICAKTNNGIGIAGIAPNCTVKYSRIPNFGLDYSTVAGVLLDSQGYNADVISCSWEFYPEEDFDGMMMISEVFYQLRQVGRAHHDMNKELGNVVIFAAGNNSMTHPSYIAGWADIAVCAMNKNGTLHVTSNQSSIIAPGEEIYTTTTTSNRQEVIEANFGHRLYTPIFDQTSAACPQVAAVAALILSLNPDLYHYEVANYIKTAAKQLPSGCYQNGKLLDAGAAVQAALNDIQK